LARISRSLAIMVNWFLSVAGAIARWVGRSGWSVALVRWSAAAGRKVQRYGARHNPPHALRSHSPRCLGPASQAAQQVHRVRAEQRVCARRHVMACLVTMPHFEFTEKCL